MKILAAPSRLLGKMSVDIQEFVYRGRDDTMNLGEQAALFREYQNVLNTLVDYHSANENKYDYIFCDHPERLNPLTPEVEKADEEGILLPRESGFYVKRSKEGLAKWRVKQADMTAIVGTKCEIIVEVYRNAAELKRARGNDISIELENQSLLDNENCVLEYLTQEMLQQKAVRLSEDANIWTIKKGNEWLVEDSRTKYYVKADEGKLNVYEKSKFSIIPQCRYMRISKVDGKSDMWFGALGPCFFILNSEEPSVGHPSPEPYKIGKWRIIECYTRQFADMLKQLS